MQAQITCTMTLSLYQVPSFEIVLFIIILELGQSDTSLRYWDLFKKVYFTTGSKTDEWSSYRGCFCIDSFYRKGRFSRCEACPKGIRGILCNETILVKEGYWWKFRDYNESWAYQRFVDALMVPDEKFNHADVNFTGIFPKPYPCPKAASCLGMLNSVRKSCTTGYGGPLCEVSDNNGFPKRAICYSKVTKCLRVL